MALGVEARRIGPGARVAAGAVPTTDRTLG